jgi:DNA topoisomerase-1
MKASIVAAIDDVAARLGNTRAVCRSAYIHPAVLLGYESGELCLFNCDDEGNPGLDADERWVLAFLNEVSATARQPDGKTGRRQGRA